MRRLLTIFLFVPTLYFFLWLLLCVIKVEECFLILDNIDFEFPWWLDILIDSIAGGIAFVCVKSIWIALRFHDRESKNIVKNTISVIVGFIIAFVTHMFMQYWIVIVSIICAIIIIFIVYYIATKIKESKKRTVIKKNEAENLEDNEHN